MVTVKELQGELKARGLDTRGKKAELEARLAQAKEQPAAADGGQEEAAGRDSTQPAEGGEQQPQADAAEGAAESGQPTEGGGDEGQHQEPAGDGAEAAPAVAGTPPNPGGSAPDASEAAPAAPPAGAAGAASSDGAKDDAAAPADPELVGVIDQLGTVGWPFPSLLRRAGSARAPYLTDGCMLWMCAALFMAKPGSVVEAQLRKRAAAHHTRRASSRTRSRSACHIR